MRAVILCVGFALAVGSAAIARADDKEELEKLTKALAAKDEKTRLKSVEVLGKMGPKAESALKDVCDRLVDSSPKVSVAALVAIEQIDPKLYKPLSNWLL